MQKKIDQYRTRAGMVAQAAESQKIQPKEAAATPNVARESHQNVKDISLQDHKSKYVWFGDMN